LADAFCNKCGYFGPETAGGVHRRPSDGEWCNYSCAPAAPRATVSPEIASERARIIAAMGREAEKYPGSDRGIQLRATIFFLETEVFL
jgi:hypothetical protein